MLYTWLAQAFAFLVWGIPSHSSTSDSWSLFYSIVVVHILPVTECLLGFDQQHVHFGPFLLPVGSPEYLPQLHFYTGVKPQETVKLAQVFDSENLREINKVTFK